MRFAIPFRVKAMLSAVVAGACLIFFALVILLSVPVVVVLISLLPRDDFHDIIFGDRKNY